MWRRVAATPRVRAFRGDESRRPPRPRHGIFRGDKIAARPRPGRGRFVESGARLRYDVDDPTYYVNVDFTYETPPPSPAPTATFAPTAAALRTVRSKKTEDADPASAGIVLAVGAVVGALVVGGVVSYKRRRLALNPPEATVAGVELASVVAVTSMTAAAMSGEPVAAAKAIV